MAAGRLMKPERVLAWADGASADWALVQECAGGDEAACTRLVTDHQRMVYQLALHLLGEPQEARDLSQEVFLRVFRTLHQFRGQSTLKTWIYRIALHEASNRRRWWFRHKAKETSMEPPENAEYSVSGSVNAALVDIAVSRPGARGLDKFADFAESAGFEALTCH